ncbi:MAG: hypothetical protein SOT80_07600 [Candidatus Pseudoruminococcus sp.]|uniref:hypothetical protein n=1 Tax=Candidatus Pseudoruminococcus sp. TaxID=3101048 RepID=UPI002A7B0A1D|nr:hypothetical protein [Ruminococcus sp.]MDY2783252.1 hypothetical protein [Candidatus Pseudoruminococcus sp.]
MASSKLSFWSFLGNSSYLTVNGNKNTATNTTTASPIARNGIVTPDVCFKRNIFITISAILTIEIRIILPFRYETR